ncbi:CoA transferase, partial [Rhodococcus sp. YH1]
LRYTALGEIQQRIGNATGAASPRGIYEAQDGRFLSIAASNQGIAKRLFAAMGRPEIIEDPRYATNAARLEHNDEVQAMVKEWVGSMPRASVLETLEKFEVVSAPVNDAADVVADPHFQERTLVEITGNEIMKGVLMPGPVLHLGSYDGPSYDGVPTIGEHTAEVLSDRLGLSADRLAALAEAGVIGKS